MGIFTGTRPAWPDSKRIHRALFGAYYEEDVYDRFCGAIPQAMRAFHWRIEPQMLRQKLIFIHVPRAAGTSVVHALYGPRSIRHHSIRYYRAVNPAFYDASESFAVLRDPVERFASAYAFVRAGGTSSCRMSDVFVAQTANVRTVDDYLSFLEGRDALSLDFVMRPQAWFVTDLETGDVLVKRLFQLSQDLPALAAFLQAHGGSELSRLNRSDRMPLLLTAHQRGRIEKLYAEDFALIAAMARQRAREAETLARIAAE